MKKIVTILGIALIMLVSCSKDDDYTAPTNDRLYNMVTYESQNSEGTTFTYQGYEDSPVFTLHATGFQAKDMKRGHRTMLYYYVNSISSTTEQSVKVSFASFTIFDSLRVAAKDNILKVTSNPVQLKSMWRTGEFINMDMLLQYTGKARQYMLIMDKATADNDIVEAYLIDSLMGNPGFYYRQVYSSFFVGAAWRKPTCRTLRIYINDENYPNVKYYDFNK